MNKQRYLITTALEETWVHGQPVLFLGEWCRLYSRKELWSDMDAVVQPYHWDDRDRHYHDSEYVHDLFERMLVDLADRLNGLNGVDHSLRYWRILVGPWLAYFVNVLFDRWSSVKSAFDNFEISGTTILAGNDDNLTPNDMSSFGDLITGDEWNHYIYAEILSYIGLLPLIFVAKKTKCEEPKVDFRKWCVKGIIKKWLNKLALLYAKEGDILFLDSYLPPLNEIVLCLKFRQMPILWERVRPVQVELDRRSRNWAMFSRSESDFEKFLVSMIPKQIPKVYLEGYQRLMGQVNSLPWPKSPKLIFSSNCLWYDSVFVAYTAEKLEQGSKLAYGRRLDSAGVESRAVQPQCRERACTLGA